MSKKMKAKKTKTSKPVKVHTNESVSYMTYEYVNWALPRILGVNSTNKVQFIQLFNMCGFLATYYNKKDLQRLHLLLHTDHNLYVYTIAEDGEYDYICYATPTGNINNMDDRVIDLTNGATIGDAVVNSIFPV